jgi:hypothetical protein
MTNRELIDVAIATDEACNDAIEAERTILEAIAKAALCNPPVDTQALKTALEQTTNAVRQIIDFSNLLKGA